MFTEDKIPERQSEVLCLIVDQWTRRILQVIDGSQQLQKEIYGSLFQKKLEVTSAIRNPTVERTLRPDNYRSHLLKFEKCIPAIYNM